MSKSVLISINPKWCELIASGKKTVEVRKTKPKLETPFKVYIYCTNGAPYLNRHNGYLYLEAKDTLGGRGYGTYERLSGKVIGEFVCDEIKDGYLTISDYITNVNIGHNETCLSVDDISEYLGMKYVETKGRHKFYGWHVSDLVIYDKPRELSEFKQCHKCEYYADCYEHEYSCDGVYNLTRPPQSWCYVEVT